MYEELVKRLRSHNGWALNKTLDEAADAIEELEKFYKIMADTYETEVTKKRWVPVTERVPEPGWYLVRCNEVHKHIHRIAYCYNSVWYEDSNDITEFVTHWISLPEPPKEET